MATLNLEINQDILNINNACSNLSLILYNTSLLFYQNIIQKSIDYAPFDNAVVDYNYVAPNLQYLSYFDVNQIQAGISYYVQQANNVIALISESGFEEQFNPKLNSINQSIAQLNNWAQALYNGQNGRTLTYIVPYDMSIRTALLLNNLTLNNMNLVILFNMSIINTLNYIEAGTTLLLL